ncbi:preprotein translocase subunit YajC [Anaerocolumna xylanovorans]|uniref:Protein translocase subunit yajC n=1 Tax=Anaerocolumna xylanovorans DSM 12503 TaxID=1121345 RepID=A0A1M7YDR3_9FIRM|nr:preprotein translocase subunit YajC [Anaerocolumna xylanovorans]SHO50658.1 protein translocase subunit yajC [Anaerocolumna xylanovorans DSM 12503]
MQFGILTTGGQSGAMPLATLIMWIVVMVGIFYFMAIRPQKKQQKKMDAMLSTLENGDSVLTSGGFYGVVIDVMDDVVIVEFGNNKNCRIPMKRTAISEIEKPQTTVVSKETKE